ncbi:MAG: hypothetical protein GF346_04795 [Candidatus Eisenbacteria bacterium]|nr:hypothetical protein [Candidatus Latescibacterota bacterium]MBD3301744.1 hypothetical protein [Candidatus Eisenbacteria bacterium]
MNPLPLPRPDLVLRIGFAGARALPAETGRLERILSEILRTTAASLAEIKSTQASSGVRRFYSTSPPRLVLVNGLAEGADALAARTFLELEDGPDGESVSCSLGAVLPFDAKTYRDSREEGFREEFDRLQARSDWCIELDGIYREGPEDRLFRSRAYRAQSAVLLRQCDLLLAVADPQAAAKPGGTLETVRSALLLDLPVVLVDPTREGDGAIRILDPGTDPAPSFEEDVPETGGPEWKHRLQECIDTIVVDPDPPSAGSSEDSRSRGGRAVASGGRRMCDDVERVVQEYFADPDVPPRAGGGERKVSRRERLWNRFQRHFRRVNPVRVDEGELVEPYATYRRRATALNYHYGGLYRGAFLLNYLLAVGAVTLAVLGLLLLVLIPPQAGHAVLSPAAAEEAHAEPEAARTGEARTAEEEHHATSDPRGWILAVLGAMKLALVIGIYLNTSKANRSGWSERAVEYRYLAERLRGHFYLPKAGSLRVLSSAGPRYSSRFVRQSAGDWIFSAIVRHISPADLRGPRVPRPDSDSEPVVLRIDPHRALESVQRGWIDEQLSYHETNEDTMGRMTRQTATWSHRFNLAVIVVVVLDLVLLALEMLGSLPARLEAIAPQITPWLLFGAAILPAVVASLNGVRFQAECHRLADRSRVMQDILNSRREEGEELRRRIEARNPDPGAWSSDVLFFTERVARDMLHEVGDWSVFYAKAVEEA